MFCVQKNGNQKNNHNFLSALRNLEELQCVTKYAKNSCEELPVHFSLDYNQIIKQ